MTEPRKRLKLIEDTPSYEIPAYVDEDGNYWMDYVWSFVYEEIRITPQNDYSTL